MSAYAAWLMESKLKNIITYIISTANNKHLLSTNRCKAAF